MSFYPKSMIKKLQPGIDLLGGDFGVLEGLFKKAMEQLFRRALGLSDDEATPDSTTGSTADSTALLTKPTPADIVLLQTRNLQIIALPKKEYEVGNFQNAIIITNEVTGDPTTDPVIKRHYSRPYLPDYQKGYYDRYLFFDIRTKEVIEVTERDYIKYRDLRYKRTTIISWYILGAAEDYRLENYIYPGVENNNIDVLAQAEIDVPGVTDFFKLYKGFTEHLLSDISEYDGAVEVIEDLEEPPPPPTDEEIAEEEDLSPAEEIAELPAPIDMDLDEITSGLDEAEGLQDDIDAAAEQLIADQDAITKEMEDDLADQERRIAQLELEQERQQRINDLKMIIDVEEMNLTQDIINWSSKARRKKKRRRLDQTRDETKINTLFDIVFNGNKHPELYTGEEMVISTNESSLRSRVKLSLSAKKITAVWTRNQGDTYYASSYSMKNGRTVTGEHAKLYSDFAAATPSTPAGTTQADYDAITLTTEQSDAALGVLTARERNQVPALRAKALQFMKDEILTAQSTGGEFRITIARQNVYNRYKSFKFENSGNTEYSKRGNYEGGTSTGSTQQTRGNIVDGQSIGTRGTRKGTTPTKSGGGDRSRKMQQNSSLYDSNRPTRRES